MLERDNSSVLIMDIELGILSKCFMWFYILLYFSMRLSVTHDKINTTSMTALAWKTFRPTHPFTMVKLCASEMPMPVTSDLVFQAYNVRLMKVTSVFQKSWSEEFWIEIYWNDDFEVQNHRSYWKVNKERFASSLGSGIITLPLKESAMRNSIFLWIIFGYFGKVFTGNLYSGLYQSLA